MLLYRDGENHYCEGKEELFARDTEGKVVGVGGKEGKSIEEHQQRQKEDLRDLSCLLRCSLLLNALLQNWHLYFFSGASDDFLMAADDVAEGITAMLATGIFRLQGAGFWELDACPLRSFFSFLHRSIVEIVWLASVGVGLKVCLDFVDV